VSENAEKLRRDVAARRHTSEHWQTCHDVCVEIEQLIDALNHVVWIPYCGIDGADEAGQYRNWPEHERDAMAEIAVKALVAAGKLSDTMKDAPRRYIRDETTKNSDHTGHNVQAYSNQRTWCHSCSQEVTPQEKNSG
jgi:hypothetical protein